MPVITLGRYDGIFDYPYQVPLDRFRSGLIVGIPGTGKSVLEERIAEDAVAAGCGVLFADPHGESVESLARRTRHPEKLDYIAPGLIGDRCYGLNFLADAVGDPDRASATTLDLFSRLGEASQETRIVNYILGLLARTVLAHDVPSLLAMRWLLADEKFRKRLLDDEELDELDADFWRRFNKRSAYNKSQWLDSTDRRLGDLLASRPIAGSLASPGMTLPLADLLDRGRLVAVNLRDGLQPETGILFGNTIMAIVTRAALSRPPGNRPRDWVIICDEAQRLAPDSLAQLFVEGRKNRCTPVLATQTLKSLERASEPLASAAGTAGVRVTLTISGADRVVYAAEGGVDRAEQVRDLAAWHAVVERPRGFEDKPERTAITLEEWWPAPDQDQLDRALEASMAYTVPLPSRKELFARPKKARGTTGGNDDTNRQLEYDEGAEAEAGASTAPGEDAPDDQLLELPEMAGPDDPDAGADARRDPPLPFSERQRRGSTLLSRRHPGAGRGGEAGRGGDQSGE